MFTNPLIIFSISEVVPLVVKNCATLIYLSNFDPELLNRDKVSSPITSLNKSVYPDSARNHLLWMRAEAMNGSISSSLFNLHLFPLTNAICANSARMINYRKTIFLSILGYKLPPPFPQFELWALGSEQRISTKLWPRCPIWNNSSSFPAQPGITYPEWGRTRWRPFFPSSSDFTFYLWQMELFRTQAEILPYDDRGCDFV